MSPIDKISDIRIFPRLGKIRMGIKKEGQKGAYPSATDYFVCPEEVKAVYGDTPRELDIMFPNDQLELIAPQWYKCYSYTQGLICKGDGKTCKRKVDVDTGDFANKNTREWVLSDGICQPEHCPMIGSKQCRKMMSLLFILPDVPGLGVYQLDTSSFYSIVNMNSQLAPDGFIRPFTKGKIAFIPLVLSISPREVTPPGVGKKIVNVLNVTAKVKLTDIIKLSLKGPSQVLLPTLEEEEPPDDLMPEEILQEAEEKQEEADKNVNPSKQVVDHDTQNVDHEGGDQATNRSVSKEKSGKSKAARGAPAPSIDLDIVGEGFSIDCNELNEMMRAINWTDMTAKTWLASQLKVTIDGDLREGLKTLTREQAEAFLEKLRKEREKFQPELPF
jgi:hypothetical protein